MPLLKKTLFQKFIYYVNRDRSWGLNGTDGAAPFCSCYTSGAVRPTNEIQVVVAPDWTRVHTCYRQLLWSFQFAGQILASSWLAFGVTCGWARSSSLPGI